VQVQLGLLLAAYLEMTHLAKQIQQQRDSFLFAHILDIDIGLPSDVTASHAWISAREQYVTPITSRHIFGNQCGSQSALSKNCQPVMFETGKAIDTRTPWTAQLPKLGLLVYLAISCKLNSMVSALVASIQKMLQNLNIISGEPPLQVTFQKKTPSSPVGVFLCKLQTNLSLSSSSQSVQEEVPSRTRLIPWAKVLTQFRR